MLSGWRASEEMFGTLASRLSGSKKTHYNEIGKDYF